MEEQTTASVQIAHRTLYADKDATVGSVCAHLRDERIDQILVRGRQGRVIGHIPLSHVLQLTGRDPRYCTRLLRELSIDMVAQALKATIACRGAVDPRLEGVSLVSEKDGAFEVHRALVFMQGDRSLALRLLESDAACVVMTRASFVSGSLVRRAREQEMPLLFTQMRPIEAMQALWMQIPLFALMERLPARLSCAEQRISL